MINFSSFCFNFKIDPFRLLLMEYQYSVLTEFHTLLIDLVQLPHSLLGVPNIIDIIRASNDKQCYFRAKFEK